MTASGPSANKETPVTMRSVPLADAKSMNAALSSRHTLAASPAVAAKDLQMQVLESALHDATNGIAAARSFGELLLLREANASKEPNAPLIESLLRELERAGEILRNVRSGVIETYQPGDVLMCKSCGYTFVHRKAAGKMGSCRRCKSYEVTRWKP